MPETNRPEARASSLYTAQDYALIVRQMRARWICAAIPCCVLLAVMIASLTVRIEWLTTISTILIGVILIAGWDLFIKPLNCYRKYLSKVLYGRVHEAVLPFGDLSEDVNMVDGVACRSMTCVDTDAKGRPYDRLFYFDAEKTFPGFAQGEMIRVIHHDLIIADVTRA